MKFNHSELNAAIAKSGMRKTDVATALDVHLNTVSNWSHGKASPSFDSLARLLQVIGWSDEQIARKPFGDWYILNGHTSGAE